MLDQWHHSAGSHAFLKSRSKHVNLPNLNITHKDNKHELSERNLSSLIPKGKASTNFSANPYSHDNRNIALKQVEQHHSKKRADNLRPAETGPDTDIMG